MSTKIKKKEKSAAVLTVYDISNMSAKGRRDISNWLRKQIKNINTYHKKPGFAKRYTARYLYV